MLLPAAPLAWTTACAQARHAAWTSRRTRFLIRM